MSIISQTTAQDNQVLTDEQIRQTLYTGLEKQLTNQRVLVLIPDHTRTLPLPFLFREVVNILHDTKKLDFMVALGTHPPLDEDALCRLVGISKTERETSYQHIGLLNHDWENPDPLTQIGVLSKAHIQKIAGDLG
ncbi:MAG: lactate racemase domain-containing protein, partial [Chloroflexota bacterium]